MCVWVMCVHCVVFVQNLCDACLCVSVRFVLWSFCVMRGVCPRYVHSGLFKESVNCVVCVCVRSVHRGGCEDGEWFLPV